MMKIFRVLLKTYDRLTLGIETPKDILFKLIFFIKNPLSTKKRWKLYEEYLENKIVRGHLIGGVLRYRDIRFPDISHNEKYVKGFIPTYYDILFFYDRRNDVYNASSVDRYERSFGTEGTYCYTDGVCDMTIKKGDTVIDAGAWIGTFSAYASKKGAKVYAFEPSAENRVILNKTAELNGNITVVPFALYDRATSLKFSEESITSKVEDVNQTIGENSHVVQAVTLDEFVVLNNIQKIDFIKADIEGSERKMLAGAVHVMKKFAPKLSICTYHLPDDRQVLSKIITDANPKYKIIYRKMKPYAFV